MFCSRWQIVDFRKHDSGARNTGMRGKGCGNIHCAVPQGSQCGIGLALFLQLGLLLSQHAMSIYIVKVEAVLNPVQFATGRFEWLVAGIIEPNLEWDTLPSDKVAVGHRQAELKFAPYRTHARLPDSEQFRLIAVRWYWSFWRRRIGCVSRCPAQVERVMVESALPPCADIDCGTILPVEREGK